MFIRLLRTNKSAGRRGWSLVELLVVLAIISVLGVISIPVMRSFARNDMRDGARTMYTMLRAARMFAMANNVETAVVYELDSDFLSGAPLVDTLRGVQVRTIRAAQVMFRVPDEVGLSPLAPEGAEGGMVNWTSTFIPVPTTAGQRVEFPQGYALLLEAPAPEYNPNVPPTQIYLADTEDIELWNRLQSDDPAAYSAANYLAHYHRRLEYPDGRNPAGSGQNAGLEKIGMVPVYVYVGTLMDYSAEEISLARNEPIDELVPVRQRLRGVHPRMAHVFGPRGNLVSQQSAERYTLFFGPSPDTYPTERVWFAPPVEESWLEPWMRGVGFSGVTNNTQERFLGMIGIPIYIQRATGRVTMGSS